MDYTISKRKRIYDKFIKGLITNKRLTLRKMNLLGQGVQGIVYKYCDKNICTAIKKLYIEKQPAKYLSKPYTIQALKYENFIELAAMKLTNQIVLQKICPNFILNYHSNYKSRDGVCNDDYPYSSKYYNEYLDNSETYTDWVQREHTISEWYNAYFQITAAIYCMQYHFNMIHLDLHSDNVLVRTVKPGGFWKYTINNINYYVPNLGFIFYINDFGHAWIPQNFQSWVIRRKYKSKRIHKNFDIQRLFQSTLEFSLSPMSFKIRIKDMIKQLKGDTNFEHIIHEVWNNYTKKKPASKQIEAYNLNKRINVENIPTELRHLVLNQK